MIAGNRSITELQMSDKSRLPVIPPDNDTQAEHLPGDNRKAELEYLSDLLPQLRKMAIGIKEPTLAYLLEMAMMEAQLQLDLVRELEADLKPG